MPVRVCVAEDQALIRHGLCSLLAQWEDVEVVGEARDGREAMEIVPRVKPDVLLLDIRMPGLDGLAVLRGLSSLRALPPTLMLTTYDDDGSLFEALRAGAKGYLLKDVSPQMLREAIRALAAGGTLIQPALTERARRAVPATGGASRSDPPFTEREREVLRLMAGGFNNREIGDGLVMAEGTVKNHISSILLKLGVRDRTRAVLKAMEVGVL